MSKNIQRPELPRRTVQELAAIYKYEPTTRDLIVEGICDKSLLEWFLEENGVGNIVVYEISSFHVDSAMVGKWGVENNNRGRVVSLAYEMELHVGETAHLTCVADADFDIVEGTEHSCTVLLFTNHSCMEMYSFNASTLNKIFKLVLRGFPKITRPLEQLFLVRLVNSGEKWKLKSVCWERSCNLTSAGVEFDLNDYVARYLNKNSRNPEIQEFLREVSAYERKLTSDARNQIQGHDFVQLLCWYIAQHKGFTRPDVDDIERSLFTAAANSQQLEREALFGNLLIRLRA